MHKLGRSAVFSVVIGSHPLSIDQDWLDDVRHQQLTNPSDTTIYKSSTQETMHK